MFEQDTLMFEQETLNCHQFGFDPRELTDKPCALTDKPCELPNKLGLVINEGCQSLFQASVRLPSRWSSSHSS